MVSEVTKGFSICHNQLGGNYLSRFKEFRNACSRSRTKQICSSGCLHLHKFVSNSIKVLESVDVADRTTFITIIDLTNDHLPLEKALVVQCATHFSFQLPSGTNPLLEEAYLPLLVHCSSL